MNDHDLLELIAQDAPPPDPSHAGTVLQAAHRIRRRRRVVAAATGAAGTAAVVVGATIALHGSGHDAHRTATPPPSPAVHQQAPTARATAYAAAIRAVAGHPPRVLYILDHTCANVITQQPGGCHARPLPATLRSDLRRALAGFAPVTVISDPARVTGGPDSGLAVQHGGAVITLGPATVRADAATVPVSVRRSGLDGRGVTYQLSRHGTGWTVTGTIGAEWIS